jgi:hypothetical protein
MSIVSEKLETAIISQGLTYLRSININDLNEQVKDLDLNALGAVGIYSNIPEAQNLTFSNTNAVLVNETVEVHYLSLSPIDATGEQTQTLLDSLRGYADGLFDLMQKQTENNQYIDGYEISAVESIKFANEVLTGFKVSFTFPYYRKSFTCA